MTDPDYIVGLADHVGREDVRGEAWEAEFEVKFHGLTGDEQDKFVALLRRRNAQLGEKREALIGIIHHPQLLFRYQQGAITAMQFVECVRGVLT